MANIEHKNIVDPNVHEPKGIGSAVVGSMYTADGAGSGSWQLAESAEDFEQIVDKVIANTTTETTLISTGVGTLDISANSLVVGSHIKVNAQGIITNTASPNINIRFKLNGVEIVATGAQALGSVSDDHFEINAEFTVRSLGVTGTICPIGSFLTSNNDHFGMVVTSTVILDTTILQTVDVTAEWSAASASNTLTCQIFEVA